MALTVTRQDVTSAAPVKVAENTNANSVAADFGTRAFVIKNATATSDLYVGGTNGTSAANGFLWSIADGPLTLELEPGESLWVIAIAATQTLHVLAVGR